MRHADVRREAAAVIAASQRRRCCMILRYGTWYGCVGVWVCFVVGCDGFNNTRFRPADPVEKVKKKNAFRGNVSVGCDGFKNTRFRLADPV